MFKNIDKIFMILFITIISITNFTLVFGESNQIFYLNLSRVKEGQYWLLITHPMAHVSLYHLTTDLLVFILLFMELKNVPIISKYKIIFFCWILSSSAAIISLPLYTVDTFSGLSGINYGMLTIICLESYFQKENYFLFRWGSLLVLALIILKQIAEGCFQFSLIHEIHFGYVGTPIVESHAGGILAGLLVFWFYRDLNYKCKNNHLSSNLLYNKKGRPI